MRFTSYKEDNKTKTGFYELNPMPGCNQMIVSNHAFIHPQDRGRGLGIKQHRERLDKIEELGYDYVICTVKGNNMAEIKILELFNWKILDAFFNKETGMDIRIYGRRIGL